MKDFEEYLKKIDIPDYSKKSSQQTLEENLLKEIIFLEEKSKKPVLLTFIKFSFVALAIAIIVIFSLMTFFPKNYLDCNILSMKGKILYRQHDENAYEDISKSVRLSTNNSLKTYAGANMHLFLGSGYDIILDEKTEMKFINQKKENKNEICNIYMSSGTAEYKIKLPTAKSIFKVITDFSEYTVKGTHFIIIVDKEKSVELKVDEGKVAVKYKIIHPDMKMMIKSESGIYEKLDIILNREIIVEKGNSLIIKKDDIVNIGNLLNKEIYNKFQKQNIEDKDRNLMIASLDKIINEIHNSIIKDDVIKNEIQEKNEDSFKIKKSSFSLNTDLKEVNTSIRSDENFIYISNNLDNAVYCMDPSNEILKWKFKDDKLKTVSTPVSVFKNNLIFSSPDAIYILNKNGKLKMKKNINNGPVFWVEPVIGNNNLYIPTSQNIYKFTGSDITEVTGIEDADGLLYVSFYKGFLYYNDLISKSIKRFDPSFGSAPEEIMKLNKRAFMPVCLTEKYLMIIDSAGTSYRLNMTKIDGIPDKIEIEEEVLSDITVNENYFYFITNAGSFCRINIDSFDGFEKIATIDNGYDKDKYLTKKLVVYGKKIYYCSDSGNLFCYDIMKKKYDFYPAGKNIELTGNPVAMGNKIFIFDTMGRLYSLNINK
jgi:outer membrane protein assembly factor BamB